MQSKFTEMESSAESTTATAESCQPKQKESLVIRDELEDVILTDEDVGNLISQYPDLSFEGICTDIHDFRRHSPRSESDGTPPGESELDSGANYDTQDAEVQKKSRMTLRQNRLPTVSLVSEYSACEWNSCAEMVFKAFKVKSFIVEPDYFISATMSDHLDTWNEFATLDHILNFAQKRHIFRKWSDVEKEIDIAVQPFDGFKDIPHFIHKRGKEKDLKALVYEFTGNVTIAQKSVDYYSDLHSWFLALESFAQDLAADLFGNAYVRREDMCQNYVFALLRTFQRCIGINYDVREKKILSLDLRDKVLRTGREMSVRPDLMVMHKDRVLLVGEVKGFMCETKNEKSPPKKDEPQKTEEVALPQLPSEESSPGDQNPINVTDKDVAQDLALGGPHKRKCEESDHPSTATQPKLVKTSPEVIHDAVKQSDAEVTSAKGTCGASSKEDRNKKLDFRPLRTHEKYKVEHFLPRLFAEMLASMANPRRAGAKIGCNNEKVQLGFAVDGFMWRFVKLVVRHTGNAEPSVSNIRSPNVVCDLFLTKEYNLFNKRHVKMIFQMLYAICHLNEVK